MNVDRKLQKAIRRIVLARIRASPSLSVEHWRVRGGWRYYIVLTLVVMGITSLAPFVLVALPAIAGAEMVKAGASGPVLAAVAALVTAAITIGHASWLTRELIASRTLAVATQLPISDSNLVRNRTAGSLLLTLAFLAASSAWFGGVIVTANLTPLQRVLTGGLAVLQWMMMASCSVIVPAWCPRLARPEFIGIMIAITMSAFAMTGVGAALNMVAGHQIAIAGLAILPTGWVLMLLQFGILNPTPGIWWLLVPIGLAPLCAWHAYGRLREKYRVFEISLTDSTFATAVFEDPALAGEDENEEEVGVPGEPRSVESTQADQRRSVRERLREFFGYTPEAVEVELTAAEATDRVHSREFLEPLTWPEHGPVERIVGSVLTEREQRVAEVMLSNAPRWSRRLLPVVTITAIVLGLLVVGHVFFQVRALSMCWQLAIVTAGFTLQGSWPSALWRCSTGHVSSLMGVLPVSDREVTRVTMVLGAARSLVLAPYALVLSAAIAWSWKGQFDLLLMATIGGKMVLLYAALHQWYFLAIQPSTSSQRLLRQLGDSALIILLMFTAAGGGFWLFLSGTSHVYSLLAATLLFSSGWLAQRLQRRRVRNQPIDLITMRQDMQQLEQARRQKISREVSW